MWEGGRCRKPGAYPLSLSPAAGAHVLHHRQHHYPPPSTTPQIPYFNAGIFLQNKSPIGKVDEIFGPTTEVMFTIKCADGVKADAFKSGDKVYISPDKLLPMARFLPPP